MLYRQALFGRHPLLHPRLGRLPLTARTDPLGRYQAIRLFALLDLSPRSALLARLEMRQQAQ